MIKNQLRLLLPGVEVFLDVDDLESIAALEEYISSSRVVLLFLSRGYLRSVNCQREVRAALANNKPIVLVQEVDPEKGGGALAELRAECPAELQNGVFDNRQPIPWHRIREFQLVSLKLIAEATLLQTPRYCARSNLPLYLPGELRSEGLSFTQPLILWTSTANRGARALAEELHVAFPRIVLTEVPPPGLLDKQESQATNALQWLTRRVSSSSINRDGSNGEATHMLLYLNSSTWSDELLAKQVTAARAARLPIIMAHERDPARGGCLFARMFEVTPQQLIVDGLYKNLARSCFPDPHRKARGTRVLFSAPKSLS